MKLSPRLLQVVELIGGKRLSYKRAAREMGGISPRTVEEYAAEIRARAGLALNPRDALTVLWSQLQPAKKRTRKREATT